MLGQTLVRRVVWLLWVLLGMSLLAFVISHVIPSDPAALAAGREATPEQIEQVRRELGLDQPLWRQYLSYMSALAHGDLGTSVMTKRPVLRDILIYLPASIELSLASMLLSVPTGILLGVVSARRRGRRADFVTRLICIGGAAVPIFAVALILQFIFYGTLRWLPAGGRIGSGISPPLHVTGFYLLDSLLTGNLPALWSSLRHLVLPALTVAFANLLQIIRMTRSSMLEVLGQEFIRVARAKGLPEGRVIYRHALRNALIPVVTIVGMQLPATIAWLFLVEAIFSWPGFGSYGVRAIMALDFPAVMGVVLFTSGLYAVANLLVDISYTLIDPRVRL